MHIAFCLKIDFCGICLHVSMTRKVRCASKRIICTNIWIYQYILLDIGVFRCSVCCVLVCCCAHHLLPHLFSTSI